MKKQIITALALVLFSIAGFAQTTAAADALQNAVTKLDQAQTARDYEVLEKTFAGIAAQSNAWLPYYYAAFCNAKIGFLYQDDGDKIEPYSNRGEEQAKKAASLLDTVRQKNELSEVYTVLSMVYRTKVFINPMTYGRKYGMLSDQYLRQATQLYPQNPRAAYVAAWVKYNTPKMWGGDKQLAKQLATESLQHLGNASAGVNPHWGKAEDTELLSKYK
ncbi:hypothetical protein CLV51_106225 [Chitinophaga niastensis]|uniref:Uncharacterized protein n=1 Tax=Chitinophaga niastensis TaxID=536980 RepID=A0A2P8HDS2_CHINA|nr:hypothetical protein [Chitinophaga niastensis]PSL44359.1 hypothetical protein CLV51_106225 [Chitinophaga niastensis]